MVGSWTCELKVLCQNPHLISVEVFQCNVRGTDRELTSTPNSQVLKGADTDLC